MINPNAKAQQIVDESNALLTYANGITSASDVTLGDAIRTLAEGYGQGGGGHGFPSAVEIFTKTFYASLEERCPNHASFTPSGSSQTIGLADVASYNLDKYLLKDYMIVAFGKSVVDVKYLEEFSGTNRSLGSNSLLTLFTNGIKQSNMTSDTLYRYGFTSSTGIHFHNYETATSNSVASSAQGGISSSCNHNLTITSNNTTTQFNGYVSKINNVGFPSIILKSTNMSASTYSTIDWEQSYHRTEFHVIAIPLEEAQSSLMWLAMFPNSKNINPNYIEYIKGEN